MKLIHYPCKYWDKGFTLLEILLAISLSLLLTLGLLYLFVNTTRFYRYQLAYNKLQADADLALSMLQSRITASGYGGCRSLKQLRIINLSSSTTMPDRALLIFHHTGQQWNDTPLPILQSKQLADTDAILLTQLADNNRQIIHSMVKQTQIDMPAAFEAKLGNTMMIADCRQASLFSLVKIQHHVTSSSLLTNKPLDKLYEQAVVGNYIASLFYVAATDRRDSEGLPINALYFQYQDPPLTRELIDGVIALKMDVDLGDNHWQAVSWTSQEPQWLQINRLKINILLRSTDLVSNHKQTINFHGEQWVKQDRHLYYTAELLMHLANG